MQQTSMEKKNKEKDKYYFSRLKVISLVTLFCGINWKF